MTFADNNCQIFTLQETAINDELVIAVTDSFDHSRHKVQVHMGLCNKAL